MSHLQRGFDPVILASVVFDRAAGDLKGKELLDQLRAALSSSSPATQKTLIGLYRETATAFITSSFVSSGGSGSSSGGLGEQPAPRRPQELLARLGTLEVDIVCSEMLKQAAENPQLIDMLVGASSSGLPPSPSAAARGGMFRNLHGPANRRDWLRDPLDHYSSSFGPQQQTSGSADFYPSGSGIDDREMHARFERQCGPRVYSHDWTTEKRIFDDFKAHELERERREAVARMRMQQQQQQHARKPLDLNSVAQLEEFNRSRIRDDCETSIHRIYAAATKAGLAAVQLAALDYDCVPRFPPGFGGHGQQQQVPMPVMGWMDSRDSQPMSSGDIHMSNMGTPMPSGLDWRPMSAGGIGTNLGAAHAFGRGGDGQRFGGMWYSCEDHDEGAAPDMGRPQRT